MYFSRNILFKYLCFNPCILKKAFLILTFFYFLYITLGVWGNTINPLLINSTHCLTFLAYSHCHSGQSFSNEDSLKNVANLQCKFFLWIQTEEWWDPASTGRLTVWLTRDEDDPHPQDTYDTQISTNYVPTQKPSAAEVYHRAVMRKITADFESQTSWVLLHIQTLTIINS